MQLAVGARSDVGMIRSGNEDNFFAEADERRGVLHVAALPGRERIASALMAMGLGFEWLNRVMRSASA